MAERVKVDCRKLPSDQPCTVTIAGSVEPWGIEYRNPKDDPRK